MTNAQEREIKYLLGDLKRKKLIWVKIMASGKDLLLLDPQNEETKCSVDYCKRKILTVNGEIKGLELALNILKA